jgi:hypothetical protein
VAEKTLLTAYVRPTELGQAGVSLFSASADQHVTVMVAGVSAIVEKDALLIAAKAVCEEDER